MREILLALSFGLMFLYGLYLMKKVDDFLEEVQKYNNQQKQEKHSNTVDEHTDNMV